MSSSMMTTSPSCQGPTSRWTQRPTPSPGRNTHPGRRPLRRPLPQRQSPHVQTAKLASTQTDSTTNCPSVRPPSQSSNPVIRLPNHSTQSLHPIAQPVTYLITYPIAYPPTHQFPTQSHPLPLTNRSVNQTLPHSPIAHPIVRSSVEQAECQGL